MSRTFHPRPSKAHRRMTAKYALRSCLARFEKGETGAVNLRIAVDMAVREGIESDLVERAKDLLSD